MDKRPNVRAPKSTAEQIARDMREGTFPRKSEATLHEEMAADRLEQQSYPTNNFALTTLVLVGLIVVIGLAFAFGLVK